MNDQIIEIIKIIANLLAFLFTGIISYKKATKRSDKNVQNLENKTHQIIEAEIEKKAIYGPLYVLCPSCGAKIMITKNSLHEEVEENGKRKEE